MSTAVKHDPRPYFDDFERWIDERVRQADRELSEKIAARVIAANHRLARNSSGPHLGHYVADDA